MYLSHSMYLRVVTALLVEQLEEQIDFQNDASFICFTLISWILR